MSFFQGAGDAEAAITAPMSVHTRRSVGTALEHAARETGVRLASVTWHDRSVMIGRHTTTGAFTPGLPNYRSLVNRLHDGDATVVLDDLRFSAPGTEAPAEITDFFATLETGWNACLARTAAHEAATGAGSATRSALALELRDLEHRLQRGLGAAHSLIAVAITE
jgi:alkyl sulfatase BDS1-like metallo-beta-lactamase superfamily hydrolase